MDPAELIDSRPNDGPLALWRNKIVLGVHHEGAAAMPTEWKIVTDRLVLSDLTLATCTSIIARSVLIC